MFNSNKIAWNAPQWSSNAGKRWWELKKCLLSKGPLISISIATIATSGLIIFGCKIAFPAIVIPNLLPLLFAFPMLMGHLALTTYLNTRVAPKVTVTSKKIIISQGQSTKTLSRDRLTSVVLAIHDNNKTRLRIRHLRRGKSQLTTVGMSWEVSLLELESLLEIEIKPRDYRREKQHRRNTNKSGEAPHFNYSDRMN